LKKALVIIFTLLVITSLFAETRDQAGTRRSLTKNNSTRTEIIAWQETFEDGAPGWLTTPTGASNLWHIAPVADAPSPTNAMINQNTSGSYNASMQNYLYSPSITLPLSGAIKADFMMKGSFTDPSPITGPLANLDYWGWEISPNNGSTWYRMSNPYNSPTGSNYVFIDAPSEWTYVTEGYNGLNGLISDYAGQTVKFRIYFRSDSDTPVGPGIMIDNFTIFNDIFMPSPTDLAATISGQTVQLNWTAPPSGFSTETITSTNSAWTSFVSDADYFAMKIVNPFTGPLQLHAVSFMLYRQNSAPIAGNPTIHVFADNAGLPGAELASVANVSNISNMSWKMVDVTSHNVFIPGNGSVFVGISNIDDGGAPNAQGLLCDSTSVNTNSFAFFDGMWEPLTEVYTGLRNCALAGVYWVDDPFAPILTGFKVYRALNLNGPFEEIGTITNPNTITFTDESPVVGQLNHYYTTAVFDGYESEPSNIATVDLIGLLYTELSNDDGTSNENFNVGTANTSAVKFVTQPNATLHYAKVYINSIGNSAMIIRIFDNNGTGGLPGTQLLQFTAPISSLSQGWNNLPLPTANIVTDADGIFYIAIYEYGSASVLGLDTNSNGNSWKKIGTAGAWTAIAEGNVMIRALVNWGSANEEYTEVMPVSNLTGYPNPFRSSTDLNFTVEKAGNVSLKIYNLKGQFVRNLMNTNLSKGSHKFTWDGKDDYGKNVGIGMYFCKVEADGKKISQKIIRIK